MSQLTFQVRKSQLSQTRLVTTPDLPLADGQVRVKVDHFALTANNITYAAFGDAMNYWQFFPVATDAADDGAGADLAAAIDDQAIKGDHFDSVACRQAGL